MKFGIYHLAFRNLRRKPFRTAVLVFSIALLVSSLVFSLSFTTRVDASITRVSDRLGGDLILVPAGARGAAEEFLLESKIRTFYMDAQVLGKIRAFKSVDKVTHQTYLTTIPGVCCGIFEAQVIAFDEKSDFVVSPWLKKAINRDLVRGEVIVGSAAYEDLELLAMESAAFLFGENFKVAGVLEESGTSLDRAIFMRGEDLKALIREGKAQLGIKQDQISVAFVKLKKGYDVETAAREMEGAILEADIIPRGKIGEKVQSAMKDLNKIFSVALLLAAALSLFLAWSVFSTIVNERRREAGIIRSIGATRAHLFKIFLLEALLIGIAGSTTGAIGGNLLANFLSGKFTLLATLSISLDALTVAGISFISFIIGVGICIIGALFPILRVSRMEPLSAIKEE